MVLSIVGHPFHYEMENLCRVFFYNEEIKVVYEDISEKLCDETVVATKLLHEKDKIKIKVTLRFKDYFDFCESDFVSALENKDYELKMAQMLFNVLAKYKNYKPQWGILTGVRPSKLMLNMQAELGTEKASDYFRNELFVSLDKCKLLEVVANAERRVIAQSCPNSYSLYIAIPFCPSRCSYCSFVSHSITADSAKALLPKYFALLLKELEFTANTAKQLGLRLESIYVGGGTPTVLEPAQIEALTDVIVKNYDMSAVREFTFEAGRPDTITADKLGTLKKSPVTRISINPQTFNDGVLQTIGRKHTTEDFLKAYHLAKEYGFDNINMDLIAGLPGDNMDSFRHTIDHAVGLDPQGITVHTLAIKRSSGINFEDLSFTDGNLTDDMLKYAKYKLTECGYSPYYMYRQSKSVGNLENVGWCQKGREGLYNIYMMEECHSVLAVGAGAVTKLKDYDSDYIERVFNFKYPYEYIERYNELIERKEKITIFYHNIIGGKHERCKI